MPYADSDFFLALLKKDDWLKERAKALLKSYKGKIWTSKWTLVEILLLAKEYGLDPEKVAVSIKNLADIEDANAIVAAARLMERKNMTIFDALHAVSCKKDFIISSDKKFDEVGLKRIKLEETSIIENN